MPTFDDYVNLCAAAYGTPAPTTVTIPVTNAQWVRIATSGASDDPVTGYFGAAYQNTLTHEIILVNRGTNDLKDVADDAQMLLDEVPDQLDSAQAFYNIVRGIAEADINHPTLSITGHSLGGSLTQLLVASHADDVINGSGVFGQTFNALGVNGLLEDMGLPVANYAVTNWVVPTDVVGNLAEHVGDKLALSNLPFSFVYLAGLPGLLDFAYDSHEIFEILDNFNTQNAHPLLQATREFLIRTYVTNPGFSVNIDGEAYVGGNDRIVGSDYPGGPLNDLVFGGRADDRLHGGSGDDVIYGGPGNDTIWGGMPAMM